MGWTHIEAQHSNATASVTLRDLEGGAEQTIVSNRIHPYFVQTTRAVPASSEGRVYTGDLPNGHWVDAAHLARGDRLPTDDATSAEVVAVGVEARPLTACNLTVADFHTYFVAANTNAAPVWVHNNCWDVPPEGAVQQTTRNAFGQETWDLGGTPLYRGYDGRIYNANVFPPSAPPSLTISDAQFERKSRQHMRDFGLDIANAAHRQQFRELVENIGSNPDGVFRGTMSGGGPEG